MWPIYLLITVLAALAGAPFRVPSEAVIVIVAAGWVLASRLAQGMWDDLSDGVRLLHLATGAVATASFVLAAVPAAPDSLQGPIVRGAVAAAGPLLLIISLVVLRVARRGHLRLGVDELLDAAVHLLIPAGLLVAALTVHPPPEVWGHDRPSQLAAVGASAIAYGIGVILVINGRTARSRVPFLAAYLISLACLGWLLVVVPAAGLPLNSFLPKVVVVPTLLYVAAVNGGELRALSETRLTADGQRVAALHRSRWMAYAAVALTLVLLAGLLNSVYVLYLVAGLAALAVARLGVVSSRLRAGYQAGGVLDALAAEMATAAGPLEILERATDAARRIVGSDRVVVRAGDYSTGPGGDSAALDGKAGTVVVAHHGAVRVETGSRVDPVTVRVLIRLADMTSIALRPVPGSAAFVNPAEPSAALPAPEGTRSVLESTPSWDPSDLDSGMAQEARLRVDGQMVVGANYAAIELLGHDPVGEDANRYVSSAATGAPFRSAPSGQWVLARHVDAISLDSSTVVALSSAQSTPASDRFDPSSGLPNLYDFEMLGELDNVIVTVFYLHDLERVRESVGGDAGESFVRRVADRASRSIRGGQDRIWRGDGAKLIVMTDRVAGQAATDWEESQNPAEWIESRRAGLATPTALGMSFIAPAISAGFAVIDKPCSSTEALQRAEMALMCAREEHPRSTVAYTADLHARVARSWEIESHLAAALDDLSSAGFRVDYQPIIGADSGLVGALEALARWNDPELGPVSPGEFIPIAEKVGIVDRIDDFVLRRAVEDLALFRDVDPDLSVQVNLSPTLLESSRLAEIAKFILRHLGGDDPGVTIEITESILSSQQMSDLEQAFSFFREANIGIAVDDFGTGESNFERMSRLPFTQVKLANQFARSNDPLLVANVVQLIHGLGMVCAVEGVETEAQYRLAVDGGGDLIQGWFFSAALPIDEALTYCRQRREEVESNSRVSGQFPFGV